MTDKPISEHDRTPSVGVWLVVIYAWWLFTTPYNSSRLAFLASIHFERILAGGLALSSLCKARSRPRDLAPFYLVSGFFFVSLLSAFLSPLASAEGAQLWIANYWKLWILYVFITLSLDTDTDVYVTILGIAAISFGYQLLTWRDFIAGGSYVYQQGMKRMAGAWSGGGLGSANGYAFLALLTLPFSCVWIVRAQTSRRRAMMIGTAVVSVASIIFSGTRGALLVGVFVGGGVALLFSRTRVKYVAMALAGGTLCYAVAPDEIRDRYTNRLLPFLARTTPNVADQDVATSSAEGRVEGLKDGFLLFLQRPLLGWGPGTSARARLQLEGATLDSELQLHSLYGQVLSETGACGTLFFFGMVFYSMTRLVRASKNSNSETQRMIAILLTAYAINLLYGFVGHTLYRESWIFLFGLSTILYSNVDAGRADCGNGRSR